MKYLFFDIECADGGKSTICSFGYVVADQSFRVIERGDLIMNPEGRFFLTGREGRPDVKLAYPISTFRSAPTFPHFYEQIKTLLEYEEYYVIGHAIANDVKYLNNACKRYKLPAISFSYFDTQRMFQDVKGGKRPSLEHALEWLEVDVDLQFHRSEDDAFATMLVLRELLAQSGQDFTAYRDTHPNCTGKTAEFTWAWDEGGSPSGTEGSCGRSAGFRLEKIENAMLKGRRNYTLFLRYLDFGKIEATSDLLAGKRVCVSLNYESTHFREMVHLVELIRRAGGDYVLKGTLADIFASDPQTSELAEPPRTCTRRSYVEQAIADGAEITVTTLDQLLAMLGTTREDLSALPEPDLNWLLEKKYARKK